MGFNAINPEYLQYQNSPTHYSEPFTWVDIGALNEGSHTFQFNRETDVLNLAGDWFNYIYRSWTKMDVGPYDLNIRPDYTQYNYNINNDGVEFSADKYSYWEYSNLYSYGYTYSNWAHKTDTVFDIQIIATDSYSENDVFMYSTDGENISYAKLGSPDRINYFTYDDSISYYGGDGDMWDGPDILILETCDPKTINLAENLTWKYSGIGTIDARNSWGGNWLEGDYKSNKIYAAFGDALWGGGGNDELFGNGWGFNTFYYGVGEGKDTVYNWVSSDLINLYNVSLDDISAAGEVDNNLVISMTGGGSLTIDNPQGNVNFQLGDGSRVTYNTDMKIWF